MYAEPKFMIAPDASKLPKPFVNVLEKKEQTKNAKRQQINLNG